MASWAGSASGLSLLMAPQVRDIAVATCGDAFPLLGPAECHSTTWQSPVPAPPHPALPGPQRPGNTQPCLPVPIPEPLGAMDLPGAQALPKPRLGEELQVTSVTSDSVGLAWTVLEGQFDSFVVQYKDTDGQPRVVPVDGSLREVRVLGLDSSRRYKLLLYGLRDSKRVGPLSAVATTGECSSDQDTWAPARRASLVQPSHPWAQHPFSLLGEKESPD